MRSEGAGAGTADANVSLERDLREVVVHLRDNAAACYESDDKHWQNIGAGFRAVAVLMEAAIDEIATLRGENQRLAGAVALGERTNG